MNVISNDGKPTINQDDLLGGGDLYEDIDLILNGNIMDVDPLTPKINEISDEQKKERDNLVSELPKALDIILFTNNFEPDIYLTRDYERKLGKIFRIIISFVKIICYICYE